MSDNLGLTYAIHECSIDDAVQKQTIRVCGGIFVGIGDGLGYMQDILRSQYLGDMSPTFNESPKKKIDLFCKSKC